MARNGAFGAEWQNILKMWRGMAPDGAEWWDKYVKMARNEPLWRGMTT